VLVGSLVLRWRRRRPAARAGEPPPASAESARLAADLERYRL